MKPRVNVMRKLRPALSGTYWAMLRDEPLPENFNEWEAFKGVSRELWQTSRDEVLREWIRDRPGTRPSLWWQFDAPRLPESEHGDYEGWAIAKDLIIPRARLGGKGTPSHEVLGIAPHYRLGLPTSWVDDFDIEYYNGRAKDVYGNRIVTDYHEGDFIAERFDQSDPPQFESQSAYLRRLQLFAPGEARRVRKSQYAPERITWK